jgi:isopenicillin N synthase-like dioxygenase
MRYYTYALDASPTQSYLANTRQKPDKYVYFHSGSEATYRKVSEKPTGFTSIPTIDISNIDGSLAQRRVIAAAIRDACEECGFFYIKNHSIPQTEVDEVFALLKRFFALDTDVKMDAHVQKNPAIRGYEPMLETRLDPRTQGGELLLCEFTPRKLTHRRCKRSLHNGRLLPRARARLRR